MEKEEQKWEQAEMKEEAEETTPLVRKSRNGGVSNGVSESNGHAVELESSQNGAENEEMITPAAEEQKLEESDGVLENEIEYINAEQKIEKSDGVLVLEFTNRERVIEGEGDRVLENKSEFINGEQKIEKSDGILVLEFTNGERIIEEEGDRVLENISEFINGEQKIEESDGIFENESEFINGEQKIEKSDGVLVLEFTNRERVIEGEGDRVLENKSEFINGEQKIEESDGILENEPEFINGVQKIEKSDGVLVLEITNRERIIEEGGRGLENISEFINGGQKIEESDGILENESEFSNGVQKIEESNGFLENESDFTNGEQKIEESDSFLEIEPEAINGELKPENLVFHDKDEGVETTLTCIEEENGISSPNLQHFDSSSEDERSHYEPSREIESAEIDVINEDDLEIAESDVERVIQKQTTHDLYCPNCKSCITKRVILRKRKRRIRILDEDVKRNRTGTPVGPRLGAVSTQSPEDQVHQERDFGIDDAEEPTIDEGGRDREPDIFRCLSCFSFFIPTGDGFKLFKKNWFTNMFAPNKHETAVEQGSASRTNVQQVYTAISSSDTNSAHQSGQPSSLEVSEGLEGTTGINITHEGRVTSLIFPNLKPSVDGKVTSGGGKVDMEATEAVGLEGTTEIKATHGDRDKALPFPNLRPFLKWKPATAVGGKLDMRATEAVDATIQQFDVFTADQLMDSKPIQEVHINRDIDHLPMKTQVTDVESAEDGISFPQQDGGKLLITSNKGSPIPKNIEEGNKPNQTMQTRDKQVVQISPPSVSVIQASDVNGNLNISVSIPHEEQDVTATIVTKSVLENKNVDSRSSDSGEVYPAEVPQQIITETKIEVHPNEAIKTEISSALLDAPAAKGNDTVIIIDRQPQPPAPSHIAEGIILPAAAATASQSETQVSTADRGGERKIEVIKSIVYGGLAESITSLSVVSSAAGGGAATLNILALGGANLIGGLFVISHNLWDLRCDHAEQVSNQITEQKDHYRELLGRRQNFVLHAVVALISYLMFGLVAPVVYGFSFRETDDKQLKLVVAAASSLLCILTLAVAKAYVQRPPKPYLKTIFTFMIVGFMVSGVSYAAGQLVERLLEKLGLFEAGSAAPNLLVQETRPVGSGWASY